jgi:hypothetical protein
MMPSLTSPIVFNHDFPEEDLSQDAACRQCGQQLRNADTFCRKYVKPEVLAERERCAKIAEDYFQDIEYEACGSLIAAAIRSGE